mgnify:CR=1 FL=1
MMARFRQNCWFEPALIALIIIIIGLVLPSTYYFRIATLVLIAGLSATGLNLLLGYAGQISLGHAGFVAIGAYAVAILPATFGVPSLVAVLCGTFLSAVVALVIGKPILRLKDHFLAVATLAFGILIAMVLNNEQWLTGGPDGMAVPRVELFGIRIRSAQSWYWICGGVLVLAVVLARNLLDSSTGRALRALHDSEVAARSAGIDVARIKSIVFVISAVFASLSGSLYALFNGHVTPDIASFLNSIEIVTMVVLGGMGSLSGGLVGAVILVVLPQALSFFHEYEHLLLGVLMILILVFMRAGIVPTLAARWARGRI